MATTMAMFCPNLHNNNVTVNIEIFELWPTSNTWLESTYSKKNQLMRPGYKGDPYPEKNR